MSWLWIAYFVMFVVQVYLFVAIPCWLLGAARPGRGASGQRRA